MERRGKSSRIVILIFFIFFLTWSVLQFLAPLSLPHGSINNLSGLTVVSDNDELFSKLPIPWNVVYSIGDRLCHQKAERSFFINDNQMPFCSRCTAIWLGLVIGLLFMIFYKIQLDGKFMFIILLCVFPMGLDGVGQLIGLWESTNLIRFITGLLTGFICGVAIGVIIDEFKGIIVLKKNKLIH